MLIKRPLYGTSPAGGSILAWPFRSMWTRAWSAPSGLVLPSFYVVAGKHSSGQRRTSSSNTQALTSPEMSTAKTIVAGGLVDRQIRRVTHRLVSAGSR